MKGRYKVLPVPTFVLNYEWETSDPYWVFEDCRYPEITPIFNRDGRYYDRLNKIAWIEFKGKAFQERDKGEMFLYELNHLTMRILSRKEIEAFTVLRRERLLTSAQLKLMRDNMEYQESRRIYYGTRLWVEQILKK